MELCEFTLVFVYLYVRTVIILPGCMDNDDDEEESACDEGPLLLYIDDDDGEEGSISPVA